MKMANTAEKTTEKAVISAKAAKSQVVMAKRESVKLHRLAGDQNRITRTDALVLWYDSRQIDPAHAEESVLKRISHLRFTGIVLYPDNFKVLWPHVGPRLQKILHVADEAQLTTLLSDKLLQADGHDNIVIASSDTALLSKANAADYKTCLRAYVDDSDGLHQSIRLGSQNAYVMIRFRDPTNIPLELVIASLQGTKTILVKEINEPTDVDDAIVTLGVMEVGADGVMFSPTDHGVLDAFVSRLDAVSAHTVAIETATVVRSEPAGMGYRSCIDLVTMFEPTEGMLIGSTSQGGILCCPEVFYLPYMELRPFRVNAGGVHSYVYNFENRTDYMSELRAGSQIMIVDGSGKTRKATVGRMKTEVRPLRLIEIEFTNGTRANVIMQDDWHVRIFSHDMKPLNITELKPGDKVLGYPAHPGRHVGIKVDENIIET